MKVVFVLTNIKNDLELILKDKPKALLKINGKTLIERQIEEYLKAGFIEKDIIIVDREKIEKIKEIINKIYKNIKVDSDININNESVLITNDNLLIKSEGIKKVINNQESVADKDCDVFFINTKDISTSNAIKLENIFNKNFKNKFNLIDVEKIKLETIDELYQTEKLLSNFTLKNKKAFIFDLDGTVYLGNIPIQNTIDFIVTNYHKYKFYFMTNNTSKNIAEYINKLNSFEIPATIDRIITPLIPLVDYLNDKKILKIFPLANTSMKNYLAEKIPNIIFTENKDECQAVVMGFDTELTYDKLKKAAYLLADKNIEYLATHSDNVCPTDKGDIPDVGSFIALFEKTVKRVPDKIFGKPNKILLEPILKKYSATELAIFGDRIYTDKVLANNANIDFVLVLSGETKRVDVENLERFPELIVNDCGELV